MWRLMDHYKNYMKWGAITEFRKKKKKRKKERKKHDQPYIFNVALAAMLRIIWKWERGDIKSGRLVEHYCNHSARNEGNFKLGPEW